MPCALGYTIKCIWEKKWPYIDINLVYSHLYQEAEVNLLLKIFSSIQT